MNYTHRLATSADSQAIALLWQEFAIERQKIDPSMTIKPNFDFEKYISHQLSKPLSFAYVLEHETNSQSQIVGCILVYCYDEAPPPDLPAEFSAQHELENPFLPRRVGSVLGLYVQPEHRQTEHILLLVNAAIKKAELMEVSDIDVLIAADQKGIQAFLKRSGF
ncbi:MAG: GNAT family N-acetyltransferase, partial [Crocosphaera sp.]